MADVTVRAFGGLRDHLPDPRQMECASVREVVAALVSDLGPLFQQRMAASHVSVGGERCDHDDPRPLSDGDEVVLLPPFAGG